MNYNVMYQWQEEIATHLPCLNSWQKTNVALYSLGIIKAESCQQQRVARQVVGAEKEESCARRWRRFLANDKFPLEQFFREWSQWVIEKLGEEKVYLLVDETKLEDRMGAMVVGVAWQGRCIPLAWRCYVADQAGSYPQEGQVALIKTLLGWIKGGIGPKYKVLLLADRGIGNSSHLCRVVAELGWYYLFRVTANSKVILDSGKAKIVHLAHRGEQYTSAGKIFISTGGMDGYVHTIWQAEHEQPWALVTNDPDVSGLAYAQRNWEEQAFRDLKSGGWQWHLSRIRRPQHMARLLVLLALAYAWCLALGGLAVLKACARHLTKDEQGQPRRHWSLFKEGVAFFFEQVQRRGFFASLAFSPDQRFT